MTSLKSLIEHFKKDTLFKNSIYLMLSTGASAVLGFIFWVLTARLYSPKEIGEATILISATGVISYLSLFGFNSTFVRFLPTSQRPNEKINTGLILVFSGALIVSLGYILLLPHLAPTLSFVRHSLLKSIFFMLLSAFAAVNLVTDSVFIAFRRAKYNLLIDGFIQGGTKLLLPFLFLPFAAYGIFAASGTASFVASAASIFFMIRLFSYSPKLTVSRSILKQVFSFSFANYIANLLNILPPLVIPLIVVNRLGAANAGYYYLAFMVANLLYTVAYSVSQSLFAEGSYEDQPLGPLIRRSGKILAAIVIPATIVLAVGAKWLLFVFGKNYSHEATQTLIFLALAAPAVTLYAASTVVMRIRREIGQLIVANVIYAGLIIGLATQFAHRGLQWVALAWLTGHLLTGVVCIIFNGFSGSRRIAT